ncbi:MAG: porin [Chlorobiaceae bacterium]|nr:porin [Chlorobiaceae bacterium]
MKKMLSLAAMFAALSYAAPASAALNLSGDAGVRLRNESLSGTTVTPAQRDTNDLLWQYRVRLNAAADLGDGYYFKAMATQENAGGGWVTVSANAQADYNLQVSNFYFGRQTADNGYAMGRLPLNAFNNPIFDLTLVPFMPLENPVANASMDRVYGLNYNTKFLSGNLRGTLVVLDNASANNTGAEGDGKLNDGYAIHLAYTDKIGDVTIEPQFIRAITSGDLAGAYTNVTPWTTGANITVPAGDVKLGFSGFYTHAKNSTVSNVGTRVGDVNYSGYEFRVKAEYGNLLCFWDYNRTTDKTPGNVASGALDNKYTNNFVWASYKIPVHKSATGSFTIQPTLRYLTNKVEGTATNVNKQRLRTELWATVTF